MDLIIKLRLSYSHCIDDKEFLLSNNKGYISFYVGSYYKNDCFVTAHMNGSRNEGRQQMQQYEIQRLQECQRDTIGGEFTPRLSLALQIYRLFACTGSHWYNCHSSTLKHSRKQALITYYIIYYLIHVYIMILYSIYNL